MPVPRTLQVGSNPRFIKDMERPRHSPLPYTCQPWWIELDGQLWRQPKLSLGQDSASGVVAGESQERMTVSPSGESQTQRKLGCTVDWHRPTIQGQWGGKKQLAARKGKDGAAGARLTCSSSPRPMQVSVPRQPISAPGPQQVCPLGSDRTRGRQLW